MEKYQHNPRKWTAEQKRKLRDNLRELGDISGVVHDLNSDQIVGGNFRSEVFDINKCEIEIVTKYDEPNAQGTVALGFVVWEGNRYNYRQVRWTKEKCDKACITANSLGGDWDNDILLSDWAGLPLTEWGVISHKVAPARDVEIEYSDEVKDAMEIYTDDTCSLPIVPQMSEHHECFVIVTHNKIDEGFVREIFGLNQNYIAESGDGKVRKTNVIDVESLRKIVNENNLPVSQEE